MQQAPTASILCLVSTQYAGVGEGVLVVVPELDTLVALWEGYDAIARIAVVESPALDCKLAKDRWGVGGLLLLGVWWFHRVVWKESIAVEFGEHAAIPVGAVL